MEHFVSSTYPEYGLETAKGNLAARIQRLDIKVEPMLTNAPSTHLPSYRRFIAILRPAPRCHAAEVRRSPACGEKDDASIVASSTARSRAPGGLTAVEIFRRA
jgi:hypothetical protein